MAYADYLFYTAQFHGNAISEEDFPRLCERASEEIRAVTHGISDHVKNAQAMEAVRRAACALAEVLQDGERLRSSVFSAGPAVSSETVGGWSRSFRAPSLSNAELSDLQARKEAVLRLYLGEIPAFAHIFKVRSFRCPHRT